MRRPVYFLVGAGTALIACCYGFGRFSYGLFGPVFGETFRLSPTITGVIGAGSYIGYCAAITASLLLTDRIGPRRVAVTAGVVATLGISLIALAPSAWVLAVGVLVAGCSTGIVSPPLAAAVAQHVPPKGADRAQTVVNGGTGIGVLLSAPIALLLLSHWRAAWVVYALVSAAVTLWVFHAVPASTRRAAKRVDRLWRPGTFGLLLASLLTGVGSVAVWTFGRDLITTVGGAGATRSLSLWLVIGAAGIAGALAGDAVQRIGLQWAWVAATVTMASATALLAVAPSSLVVMIVAATLFGGSYIALTGLALLWGARLYPDSTSTGVGLSFFTLAAGQALGAPAAGALIDLAGGRTAFGAIAAVGLCALAVRPIRTATVPAATRP
ncbi:arabinose ABC transporter permease [Mycolicibacterium novocastrense]|uniref:YbfB/YjiJ family MFS transporter n=1 Tax=Mycolicibacterium novocastrense TaxID=59813 RepID=UPI00074A2483|nr:YbfB/YjiJ family MFS transporter [Mycolicibacterium novocastrense]KUH73665.1 arabinose ABC transporter permease [Mycolicibacterium novocastrense]KUH74757.1 arabinose ABC transporter permease [Mycolicibacterium novocastrense]KUH76072.1 arabinose ABC transporter permease [Mycolicibacterium novocastrense]